MVDSSAERDPIERLADSFLARYRAGERPSIESLAARYPDMADEIREVLPALIELELGLPLEGSTTRSNGGPAAPRSPETPRLLGDYLIIREVGRGGMGVVYEATQQSLSRHVALKVLQAGSLAGSSRLERFRLEARAAARLHHTNIVPVFGVGEQQGVHYYAMQFIRGKGLDLIVEELKRLRDRTNSAKAAPVAPTLDIAGAPLSQLLTMDLLSGRFEKSASWDQLAEDFTTEPAEFAAQARLVATEDTAGAGLADSFGPSPVERAAGAESVGSQLSADSAERNYYRGIARLGLQVAEALAYAHAEGVLHRDIKPSNLMLDARGTVWVTDFGLAKSEDAGGGLTQTGDVVGTLRYMAPERFDGRSDPRSDVYSLGATLYELLTLRPPFDDHSRVGLIQRVLRESPPSPRKLDINIPRDLETIVLKAMAKTPSARYASAEAMAEDLRRFLADRPILARRARLTEHAWRWCRRNPAVATLAASIIMLLAAVAIGSTVVALRLRQQSDQLADQRNRVVDERNRALGLLRRAQQAESSQTRLLGESLLAQARAGRRSGQFGRRFDSLAAIARAAAIRPSAELRDEAIACLAMVDVHALPPWEGSAPGGHELGFDRDLDRYAQIEHDGTVCIRRAGDGDVLKRLPGTGLEHGHPVFSPDGRWLAVPRYDNGRQSVYDLETGTCVLDVPGAGVHACATWSPDSQRFAVVGSKGVVVLYDTATWQEVARLSQGFPAQDLAYDPSGSKLAVSSTFVDEVRVFDARTGAVLWSFHHPADVQGIAWHPDGRRLATACNDHLVRILDVTQKNRPVVQTLVGHLSSVMDVAFHPEGDLLASYGWDGMIQVWDVNSGGTFVRGRVDPGSRLRFSSDGRRLACGVKGNQVFLLEVATADDCRMLYGHTGTQSGPWSMAFSPDGRTLASAGPDNVRLWDPECKRQLAIVPATRANSVAFLPQGDGLVTAGPLRVDFWPLLRAEAEPLVGPVRKLFEFPVMSPNNGVEVAAGGRKVFALDSGSGEIRVADIDRPDESQRVPDNRGARFLAVSPDVRWAATGGRKGTPVRIWDMQTNALVRELPMTESCVAFSPDGRWLVASTIWTFEFFATGTWQPGPKLKRDQAHLPGPLAFSRDGRLLALAHTPREVRIVDTATLRPLATLTAADPNLISALAFSPEANLLAVATENRVIQVWNLRSIRRELARLGIPVEGRMGE